MTTSPELTSLRDMLRDAVQRLQQSGSDSARRDAELLLLHALQRDAAWLYAHDDEVPTTRERMAFLQMLQRRERGEPVAHLLGRRGFWTLDLAVNSHTLIPRPETELLVEFALAKIPEGSKESILDLGTGSGAIALAVKSERPECAVTAVDASLDALVVATANAKRLHLPVEFLHGNWCAPLAGRQFHLILSNPPYIPQDDEHLVRGDVRFEPRSALVAGPDGLDDVRALALSAPACLLPGGWLALEHGHDQAPRVRAILQAAGFVRVGSRCDLNGHERITFGCHNGEAGPC
ncbi:MAG: peptide chain release factor N(5)-glutamine methyltransferase [Gammaproteobacteria bacterium]